MASALVALLVILALVICLSTAVHLSRTTKTRRRRRMRSESRAAASPNNVTARQLNSPDGDARSGLLSLPPRGHHRLKNPHSQTLLCLEDIRPRKVLNTTIPNGISSSRQISPEGGATVSLNDVIFAEAPRIISSCEICKSCEKDAEFAHEHRVEMHCACAEQNSGETFAVDEQERSFAFIV